MAVYVVYKSSGTFKCGDAMTDTLFEIYDPERAGAAFSPCRRYRYSLWRVWNAHDPWCVFIGLNPSTADEKVDDPTIRRCIAFAKRWKCGRVYMLNAYAFRATDPKVMMRESDPVGQENDETIMRLTKTAYERNGLIVAAWGVNCNPNRAAEVCRIINGPIHCLDKTKGGMPKHPLYIKGDEMPKPFWSPNQ